MFSLLSFLHFIFTLPFSRFLPFFLETLVFFLISIHVCFYIPLLECHFCFFHSSFLPTYWFYFLFLSFNFFFTLFTLLPLVFYFYSPSIFFYFFVSFLYLLLSPLFDIFFLHFSVSVCLPLPHIPILSLSYHPLLSPFASSPESSGRTAGGSLSDAKAFGERDPPKTLPISVSRARRSPSREIKMLRIKARGQMCSLLRLRFMALFTTYRISTWCGILTKCGS